MRSYQPRIQFRGDSFHRQNGQNIPRLNQQDLQYRSPFTNSPALGQQGNLYTPYSTLSNDSPSSQNKKLFSTFGPIPQEIEDSSIFHSRGQVNPYNDYIHSPSALNFGTRYSTLPEHYRAYRQSNENFHGQNLQYPQNAETMNNQNFKRGVNDAKLRPVDGPKDETFDRPDSAVPMNPNLYGVKPTTIVQLLEGLGLHKSAIDAVMPDIIEDAITIYANELARHENEYYNYQSFTPEQQRQKNWINQDHHMNPNMGYQPEITYNPYNQNPNPRITQGNDAFGQPNGSRISSTNAKNEPPQQEAETNLPDNDYNYQTHTRKGREPEQIDQQKQTANFNHAKSNAEEKESQPKENFANTPSSSSLV